MGKSDQKQTKKRARKANADEESKHKNKPSRLDTMTFESTDNEGRRQSQWRDFFRQLCEFKIQFGHCLVPGQYSINPRLGLWVLQQRRNYKLQQEGRTSPMTSELIRALNGIGFDWGTSKTDWSDLFRQLCEFKKQSGHCLVPGRYSANPKLGLWVAQQRHCYKLQQEGKPSAMTAERTRAFEGIGFDWGTSYLNWNARFQQLTEYKAEFGNCLVPKHYAANPTLGIWVSLQRHNYKLQQEGKPGALTAQRTRQLVGIGFAWNKINAYWNALLKQLTEYKVQFGHCRVPSRYSANPPLGRWVSTQRRNYRLSKEGKPSPLTAERTRALQSVGFDWMTAAAF